MSFPFRRRSKFSAKRVTTEDGASFPSRLEARRWGQLTQLQAAGMLANLRRQPKVLLTAAGIVYHPDFVYTEAGRTVYEETKGFETADWIIKKKLWRVYGPGVLRVMKSAGRSGGIHMAEEIHPTPATDADADKKSLTTAPNGHTTPLNHG